MLLDDDIETPLSKVSAPEGVLNRKPNQVNQIDAFFWRWKRHLFFGLK